MESKVVLGRAQMQREECLTGNWGKGDPYYKVSKDLDELCFGVLWEIEVKSDELGYLAEEISRQSVEDVTWFLLPAYGKRRGERGT